MACRPSCANQPPPPAPTPIAQVPATVFDSESRAPRTEGRAATRHDSGDTSVSGWRSIIQAQAIISPAPSRGKHSTRDKRHCALWRETVLTSSCRRGAFVATVFYMDAPAAQDNT